MSDNNISILDEDGLDSNVKANSDANTEQLGFIPPASIGSLARAAVAIGPSAARVGAKLYQGDVVGAASEAGINSAQDLLQQVSQAFPGVSAAMSGGGSGAPPTFNVDVGGSGDSGAGKGYSQAYLQTHKLSIDAHPTEIRLNTGIEVDAFTPDYSSGETSYHYALHYTGARFVFPGSSDASLIGNFWNNQIVNELWIVIQRNITFSVNSTGVTKADIATYLSNLAYALQVFYFASRYFVYSSQLEKRLISKNDGIMAILNGITSTDADNYIALRRTLNNCPIPPRLNDFLFYLMQHYSTSDLPNSPVIGLNPIAFDTQGVGIMNWSPLQAAAINLSSTSMVNAASLLGRAVPAFFGTSLYTGAGGFLHDPNFSNIFVNLPARYFTTGAGAVSYALPQTATDDARIFYNSHTEFPDGAGFALCSSWRGTTWTPSLIETVDSTVAANTFSNRTFYNFSTNKMLSVTGVAAAFYGRNETYLLDPTGVGFTRCNAHQQRVWGVTPRTITNSCYQLLDYLMSWDVMTSRSDKGLQDGGPFNPSADKFTGQRPNKMKSSSKRPRYKKKQKGA